jgi:histidyl-tRNA synthetase
VLNALLNQATIPPSQHADALVALDKLDKVGPEGVRKELEARGISDPGRNAFVNWIGAAYSGDFLDYLEGQFTLLDDEGRAAFSNLRQIRDLSVQGPANGHLQFDPSLARGLSYYTGAIMEIAVEGIGSLGGGGRYDNLVGMFLGRDVPACGFSLGLERIIVVMTERDMFPASLAQGAVDVVVTFMDDDSRGEAMALAAELRGQRLRVDVYPDAARKFEKPMKYATTRGATALAIFGENERARGEVGVRDLQTRRQEAVPRDVAARVIARVVNESH